MPWQSVPPLLIIAGAFNVAAGLMWTVQRVGYGHDRPIGRDQWTFALENREARIEEYKKMIAKQSE